MRRGLRSGTYGVARLLGDLNAVMSGNPNRIARRVKNRIIGKALARAGFWRWLWR